MRSKTHRNPQSADAAKSYLSTLPEVDASRFISVGVSAGGLATVALASDPPPGLAAAISFAGGRGSRKPDEVCNARDLVEAFGKLGSTERVPMLWVYAENDHFFGPKIADELYQAFTRAGGQATFIHAAPFRHDGLGLFSAAGIPIWIPMVEDFLASQNLKLLADLLPLPGPLDLPVPAQLPPSGRENAHGIGKCVLVQP